jgi:hypothetical protein
VGCAAPGGATGSSITRAAKSIGVVKSSIVMSRRPETSQKRYIYAVQCKRVTIDRINYGLPMPQNTNSHSLQDRSRFREVRDEGVFLGRSPGAHFLVSPFEWVVMARLLGRRAPSVRRPHIHYLSLLESPVWSCPFLHPTWLGARIGRLQGYLSKILKDRFFITETLP